MAWVGTFCEAGRSFGTVLPTGCGLLTSGFAVWCRKNRNNGHAGIAAAAGTHFINPVVEHGHLTIQCGNALFQFLQTLIRFMRVFWFVRLFSSSLRIWAVEAQPPAKIRQAAGIIKNFFIFLPHLFFCRKTGRLSRTLAAASILRQKQACMRFPQGTEHSRPAQYCKE